MQYGEPNLNEGKAWSEMDLFDLKNSLEPTHPSLRSPTSCAGARKRVREKIAELQGSTLER
jgi:hypothetical protein